MTAVLRLCLALTILTSVAHAQSLIPGTPVLLDSPTEFTAPTANWHQAGALGGDPRTEAKLVALPGRGILVNQPSGGEGARGHLVTAWEHADMDLDLEFLVPPGSNSGVYLMGRYEVQIFESWARKDPTFSDAGGIYQRWDPARGNGNEGYEGHAPRANASRAPGLWQKFHIEFRAPRFDASGKKIANARFVRVELNGFLVQENVEVTGPTRSAMFEDEKPTGPLMIQGDHGPVAVRRLVRKTYEDGGASVEGLTYRTYAGEFDRIGDTGNAAPTKEGPLPSLSIRSIAPSGLFAAVVNGTLVVPRDGIYAFDVDAREPARLMVDDRVVVGPLNDGGEAGTIELTAGKHPFRLDYLHREPRTQVDFDLTVEGPHLASHSLVPLDNQRRSWQSQALPVVVENRVLAQRGFVPFRPRKRLYALSVGTPAGAHFSYDTESGALLRAWRGGFLDTFEMWHERGYNQLARPLGPALTLPGLPAVVLLESAAHDWPTAPEALWTFGGYALEPDGTPVFSATLAGLKITDRLAPTPDARGLTRTLRVLGRTPSWEAWLLIADAEEITPQPDGRGYIIGDREHYIDLAADSAFQPVVRHVTGRQQLAVQLPSREKPIDVTTTYTLVW